MNPSKLEPAPRRLRERAGAAMPTALRFGGAFAAITLLRVLGAFVSGEATVWMLLSAPLAFVLFGGVAMLFHMAGRGGASSDQLEVSGWLSVAVVGSIVVFWVGLVWGALHNWNLWVASFAAVALWMAAIGLCRLAWILVRRLSASPRAA